MIRGIGLLIALACLGYFSVKAAHAWQSADFGFNSRLVLLRFGTASMPILLGYGAAALAWVALLRYLGWWTAPLSGAGIFLTTQFAKYLPGNVGHYVGRAVLATRRGCPGPTVALSMTVELVILLGIGLLLSAPMLGMAAHKAQPAWHGWSVVRLLMLALLAVLACGIAIAFVLRRSSALARVRSLGSDLKTALSRPGDARWLSVSVLLSAVGFVLSGISLLVLDATWQDFRLSQAAAVVSLYSVAWLVGVLTPGVPVGLGVREAILVEGLTPLFGAGQAASSALLFRLLTTLADVIAFGVGLLLLRLSALRAARAAIVR